MMSTLVCTECGEVSVTANRSVVLPFVCTGCNPTVPPMEEYPEQGVYERPLSAMTVEHEAGNYAQEIIEGQLSDETATTQNTVDMISDLEEQLQVAKELSKGQTELIEQLEKQLAVEKTEREKMADLAVDAAIGLAKSITENLDLQKDNEALIDRVQGNITAMTGGINEITRLQQEIADLTERLDSATGIAKAACFYLGYAVEKGKELETVNDALRLAVEALERFSGLRVLSVAVDRN
jgi:hypothetical protein